MNVIFIDGPAVAVAVVVAAGGWVAACMISVCQLHFSSLLKGLKTDPRLL